MNTYIVSGTSREVGAIGVHEAFQFVGIVAIDEGEAREIARDELYADNREHVLVKLVQRIGA